MSRKSDRKSGGDDKHYGEEIFYVLVEVIKGVKSDGNDPCDARGVSDVFRSQKRMFYRQFH